MPEIEAGAATEAVETPQVPDVDAIKQSAYDELAQEKGWVPKDEFKGDPNRWTDSRTWLKNAATPNEMGKLAKEVSSLKENIVKIHDYETKRANAEIKKAKEELVEQRKAAIKDADVDLVEELDGKIKEFDTQQSAQTKHDTEFDAWKAKNDWYGTDAELTGIADRMADEYPELPLPKLLKLVDKEVAAIKKPAEKKTEETVHANASETGARRTTTQTKKYSRRDLTDEQKNICDTMVKTINGFTEEKYIDGLVKTGVLG